MVSVGIYIYDNGFGVAEISLESGRLKLENTYHHFFKQDDQEEHKSIIILEYLKEIEKKYTNKPIRFCYSLYQSQISGFKVSFPFKEKFKILKTLPFQIENQSPFRSDKIFYDARITQIKNQMTEVICFVTPESNIKEFLKFSNSLETKPHLLSLEGAALANIISGWNSNFSKTNSEMQNNLYLYLGLQGSVVVVFTKGCLDNIYSIEWQGSSIIKEMSEKYRLSFEEAIRQFFEKSFILTSEKGFGKEQIFFSKLIENQVSSLIHEIKLLKLSLETKNKVDYNNNFILGPASVIKNFSAYLSTETSSLFSRFKKIGDLSSIDLSDFNNQNLIIPLGLAMEGLKKPPYEGINFLHSLNKQKFQIIPKKWKSVIVSFLIIVFVFSVYVFIRGKESQNLADQMQSVFIDYGKKIASLRESQVSINEIKKYLDHKKDLVEAEDFIKKNVSKKNAMDKLKSLTTAIDVKKAWELHVQYLEIKKNKILIKGSINKEFVKTLKQRLKKISKGSIKELKVKNEDKKGESDSKLKSSEVKSSEVKKDSKSVLEKSEKEPLSDLVNFSYQFILKENI
ncbi:MAG: hypothetical protein ACR2M7_04555 [Bdellovibrionales bacterium]